MEPLDIDTPAHQADSGRWVSAGSSACRRFIDTVFQNFDVKCELFAKPSESCQFRAAKAFQPQ
jgi:hypothetical protein